MSGHPKAAPDKVNTLAIGTVTVAAAGVLWACVMLLQAYFANTNDALEQQREVEGQGQEVRLVRVGQEAKLKISAPETIDSSRGVVRVPIEFAKAEVLKALQADPTASAVPLHGPHNKATVPAQWGRPDDNAKPPPPPSEEAPDAATEGEPAGGAGEAPTDDGEPTGQFEDGPPPSGGESP